jgi:hypothetical protein
MIVWSVRRRLAGELKSGFEPLVGLFDGHHCDIDYKDEWMRSAGFLLHL